MNNWPTTTEVLKAAGLYGDAERWFHKADREQPADYACPTSAGRGRAIDAGCNLLAMGKELQPEWLTKHEACCVPFIDGYRAFLQRHTVNLIECAFEVVNKAERYKGHPDQLIMLDGVRALIDIKTGGMPPVTCLQLASYETAMYSMGAGDCPGGSSKRLCEHGKVEAHKLPAPRVTRFGLQLARGDFKLHPFINPFDKDEWTLLVRAHWVKAKYIGAGQ